MLEMSRSREDHRQAVFVGGFDNFRVLDRTARLNNTRDAEFCRFVHVVAEREKCVGGENRIFERQFKSFRPHRCDSDRINAVHLSRADSESIRLIGENNRVRLDVFADFPREKHRSNFAFRRLSFGNDFQIARRNNQIIAVLNEHSAGDLFVFDVFGVLDSFNFQNAQILFTSENFERVRVKIRRKHDFGKNFADGFGCIRVNF